MAIWSLLSDIHGRGDRLARVLADARGQGAAQFISLGDVGSVNALDMLDAAGAACVFGNWEASGLRGLPVGYRAWVGRWPPRHRAPDLWAAHASPVWPEGLALPGVVDYLRVQQLHWTALFPSLQRSEEARRAAFAELDSAGVPVFFHGHTHVQEAWHWTPGAAPVRVNAPEITIEDGERWLVGVGSVGDPHDGNGACYVLYDTESRRVSWRRA